MCWWMRKDERMSRAIKLTRAQKEILTRAGLMWRNWLFLKESEKELVIVNKSTGKVRKVKKAKNA